MRKADQIHPDSPRPKPLPLVSKFIFPMLIVCSLLVGACQNMKGTTAGGRDPFSSVGVAFMEEDGSLTVRLRAEGTIHGRKEVGDAAFYYNKGDKEYWRIIKHVGGLKPGESKPVPPWPESASL